MTPRSRRPFKVPAESAEVDRYLEALAGFDLDRMSALWSDDVIDSDPTAGSRMEGKEQVVAGLRAGMKGVSDLKLHVHTRFVSNGHVVLMYKGSATMNGVAVSAPGVIVLRIEGDRVAEHTDFVDYGAIQGQMAASGAAMAGGAD